MTERIVRNRKAFYEKQNDVKGCNKRLERLTLKDKQEWKQPLALCLSVKPENVFTAELPKNISEAYCATYGDREDARTVLLPEGERFLKGHEIDMHLRARMLDWMVEVMSSYKFSLKAYFSGVQLLDRYFMAQANRLGPTNLHSVGVAAMTIASKMEQMHPLKLRIVYQKIVHKRISPEELLTTQKKLMEVLNYQMNSWTVFDNVTFRLHNYLSRTNQGSIEYDTLSCRLEQIMDLCGYLCRCIAYDYDFSTSYPYELQEETVMKVALDIMGCPASSLLRLPELEVEMASGVLAGILRNVSLGHKVYVHLYKFTPKTILDRVNEYLSNDRQY